MRIGSLAGLAIKAYHLLTGSVRESGEDARFGHGGVTLVFENSADGNALVAKGAEKKLTGLIVTDDADGKHVDSEIGEVVDGIAAAAGDDLAVVMLENQDGSFAGDARNFAEHELVGNQVGEHSHGQLGERLDEFLETVVFFMFAHSIMATRCNQDFLTSGGFRFASYQGTGRKIVFARMV